MRRPVIECFVTGLLAWRDGQPGQVGNEAATAVFRQCRGSGSSPSSFLLFAFFLSAVFCLLPRFRFHRFHVLHSRLLLPLVFRYRFVSKIQ